jgi:antitoxin component YwqK of YwqJK toxin-antitoxin module
MDNISRGILFIVAALAILLVVIVPPHTKRKIPDGWVRHYYQGSRQLWQEWNCRNDLPDGIAHEYYENGAVCGIFRFQQGKQEGVCRQYYENGRLRGTLTYHEGRLDGVATFYYEDGRTPQSVSVYQKGKLVNRKTYDRAGQPAPDHGHH